MFSSSECIVTTKNLNQKSKLTDRRVDDRHRSWYNRVGYSDTAIRSFWPQGPMTPSTVRRRMTPTWLVPERTLSLDGLRARGRATLSPALARILTHPDPQSGYNHAVRFGCRLLSINSPPPHSTSTPPPTVPDTPDANSPIAGMPVLRVWKANKVWPPRGVGLGATLLPQGSQRLVNPFIGYAVQ